MSKFTWNDRNLERTLEHLDYIFVICLCFFICQFELAFVQSVCSVFGDWSEELHTFPDVFQSKFEKISVMDGDFELLFDEEMSWSDYGKLKWAVFESMILIFVVNEVKWKKNSVLLTGWLVAKAL